MTTWSEFSKAKKKDHVASGTALAAGGATTAGVGVVAGGIPGKKADFSTVMNPHLKRTRGGGQRKGAPGPGTGGGGKYKGMSRPKAIAQTRKAGGGGILGFRINAHEGGTEGFKQTAADHAKGAPKSAQEAYFHGHNEGKIAPEIKVMNQMKKGRVVAAGALGAGGYATYKGVKRAKGDVSKAQRHQDQVNGAALGAGTAGAAISHGGSKVLRNQEKKWERTASRNIDEAGKIVPAISGREGKKMSLKQMYKHGQKHGMTYDKDGNRKPRVPYPKSMKPSVSDSAISHHPEIMDGVSHADAKKAGQLRGAAKQAEHFSHVYGDTAKVVRSVRTPSLIVAGAGGAGLAASKMTDKKVKKSLTTSAFGVDHG